MVTAPNDGSTLCLHPQQWLAPAEDAAKQASPVSDAGEVASRAEGSMTSGEGTSENADTPGNGQRPVSHSENKTLYVLNVKETD